MLIRTISAAGLATALALAACKSDPVKKPAPAASGGGGTTSDPDGNSTPKPGTGGTSGTNGAVDPIASCTELGERACATLERCAAFRLDAHYGDVATCRGVVQEICSGLTAQDRAVAFGRCAASLDACGPTVEAGGIPAWCWMPGGQIELGGACTADTDCVEGMCERAKSDDAGKCTLPAVESDLCDATRRCDVGLRCALPEGSCVRAKKDQESCESPFQCEPGSTCTSEGVCAPTEIGTPCVTGILPCRSSQVCILDQCTETRWADTTTSCRQLGVECSGTERCLVRQLSTFEQVAACKPTVGFGEACDAETACIEPLTCRGGSCGS